MQTYDRTRTNEDDHSACQLKKKNDAFLLDAMVNESYCDLLLLLRYSVKLLLKLIFSSAMMNVFIAHINGIVDWL